MDWQIFRDRAKSLPLSEMKKSFEMAISPNPERVQVVDMVKNYLESVANEIPQFRGSRIVVFGSQKSNILTGGSDIDFCLLLPLNRVISKTKKGKEAKLDMLHVLKRALLRRKADGMFSRIHVKTVWSRAPYILEMTTAEGLVENQPAFDIDLCIDDIEGPIITEVVKLAKARGGPIFQAVFCALKKLCKEMGVSNSKDQFPSSTVLFIMTVWYFQIITNPRFEFVDIGALKFDNEFLKSKIDAYGGLDKYCDKEGLLNHYALLDRRVDRKDLKYFWIRSGNKLDELGGPRWDGAGLRPRDVLPRVPYLGAAEKDPRTVRDHLIAFMRLFSNLRNLPSVVDIANSFNRQMEGTRFQFNCEKLVEKHIPIGRMQEFGMAMLALEEVLVANPDFEIDPHRQEKKTGNNLIKEKIKLAEIAGEAEKAASMKAAYAEKRHQANRRKKERKREAKRLGQLQVAAGPSSAIDETSTESENHL